jgi:hypothetical protein
MLLQAAMFRMTEKGYYQTSYLLRDKINSDKNHTEINDIKQTIQFPQVLKWKEMKQS